MIGGYADGLSTSRHRTTLENPGGPSAHSSFLLNGKEREAPLPVLTGKQAARSLFVIIHVNITLVLGMHKDPDLHHPFIFLILGGMHHSIRCLWSSDCVLLSPPPSHDNKHDPPKKILSGLALPPFFILFHLAFVLITHTLNQISFSHRHHRQQTHTHNTKAHQVTPQPCLVRRPTTRPQLLLVDKEGEHCSRTKQEPITNEKKKSMSAPFAWTPSSRRPPRLEFKLEEWVGKCFDPPVMVLPTRSGAIAITPSMKIASASMLPPPSATARQAVEHCSAPWRNVESALCQGT